MNNNLQWPDNWAARRDNQSAYHAPFSATGSATERTQATDSSNTHLFNDNSGQAGFLHLTTSGSISNTQQRPHSLLLDGPTPSGVQGASQSGDIPLVISDLPSMDDYADSLPAAQAQWTTLPAQSLPAHLGLGHDETFSAMLGREEQAQDPYQGVRYGAGLPVAHDEKLYNPSGIPAAYTETSASNQTTDSPTSWLDNDGQYRAATQFNDSTSWQDTSRARSAASWPVSKSPDQHAFTQSQFVSGYDQQQQQPNFAFPRAATTPQLFTYSNVSTAKAQPIQHPIHLDQPWRQVDPNFPSMPSAVNTVADASHFNLSPESRRTSAISVDLDDGENDTGASYFGSGDSSSSNRDILNRRQGVTCDQCREKHLRCDLADRSPEVPTSGNSQPPEDNTSSNPCTRCVDKGFACTKTNAPPSRRYPRPSRTGKRIEQARLMHGSVAAEANRRLPPGAVFNRRSSRGVLLDISSPENSLSGSFLSSAASLRLLTCYFATAHVQIPVVDFASFSSRYNLAQGDFRKMSLMLNGGSALENIPSIPMPLPAGIPPVWPGTSDSTISTPGTTEALVAAMHAWAAHYTDMPLAFGSQYKSLDLESSANNGSHQARSRRRPSAIVDEGDESENSLEEQSDFSHLHPAKRPKRKQGVACDTCRLRRVRCDLMERKDGMPCTRCQDKKIVCTDEYIQQKRRDNEAKLRKEREKLRKQLGSSGGSAGEDGSSSFENTNVSQLRDNPDPLAWTEMPGAPALITPEHSPMRVGVARQAFCHETLTRAVVLLHKHKLLYRPSVEAVQVMVLLIHLFDMVDPSFASQMIAASASHMRALGLQSLDEVDENDTKSVENLFNLMQDKRVWCTAWTRDAIACCVHRSAPNYFEDTPIKIKGGLADAAGSTKPAPELTPAMGLSFSVMSLLQIGVLSRFVTKHIDSITSPNYPPPQERFPMLPTAADNARLQRACHAAWKSNDALIDFFDRCTLKSWHQMEALKIHRPKVWIGAVKVSSAMVTLSIFRILGERQRLNSTYLQAVSETHGSHAIAADDIAQSQNLRQLFEESRQKTLTVCRRVARLVQKMHRRPSLTFQTGGILLKQLFAVAQFIARSPVNLDNDFGHDASESFLKPPHSGPSTSQQTDPKQQYNLATTGTFIPTVRPEAPASPSELYDLAMAYDAPLPKFTLEAKQSEVGACVSALEQVGYAWPVESEVQSIKMLMQAEASNNATFAT